MCAPILGQGNIVGTVWLVLDAEKVRKTWEMSPAEFSGIHFNHEEKYDLEVNWHVVEPEKKYVNGDLGSLGTAVIRMRGAVPV
jgi:hypothetical protein